MTRASDDHAPEPPIVGETTRFAQKTVKEFATILQALGWDSVVISLARVIEVAPGDYRAPGATATVIDQTICGPIMPQIADVLRKQASMLEKNAPKAPEASGYIHDQSDHAGGLREWPK